MARGGHRGSSRPRAARTTVIPDDARSAAIRDPYIPGRAGLDRAVFHGSRLSLRSAGMTTVRPRQRLMQRNMLH